MLNANQDKKFHRYFKDKVVIITGGAGGLGRALTEQLLASGAKVAVLDLNIESLQDSSLIDNSQLITIAVDLTDENSLKHAVNQVISHFHTIDILFNNAGITHMSCFKDIPAKLFTTIMDVNFTASVNMTRLCLPYITNSSNGQIIAISSVAGFSPLYGRSAYSASKHAMEGFFRSLGAELADEGVSVLIVSPSFVKSRPELVAKVNDGISSPGAMKKNTSGKQLSPQEAVQPILKATMTKQSSLYLGKIAHIARWLFALFPNLYVKIMTKQAKTEFK